MKLSNLDSNFFPEFNIDRFFRTPAFEAYKKEISCDLSEDKDNFYCELNAPGFDKSDLHIHLEKGQLVISGKHKETKKENNKTYHIKERSTSSFRRFVTLPHSINADKVSATYETGVLHITLPKAAESKGKMIEIGD